MSDHTAGDGNARVTELLQEISEEDFIRLSREQVANLVNAITEDLHTLADIGKTDAERLAKVEKQTRVLSEAVIAIAETSGTLAPAVQAVKDEM